MNYQTLRESLILDEALRLKPYVDTKGKTTIGVGRNLTDVGISKDEAIFLLDNDIKHVIEGLDTLIPWWRGMSDVRQHVVMNMCFNMGLSKLMGFKLALSAMESGDYETAANQMLNSAWYGEVGPRAIRLVSLMRSGK